MTFAQGANMAATATYMQEMLAADLRPDLSKVTVPLLEIGPFDATIDPQAPYNPLTTLQQKQAYYQSLFARRSDGEGRDHRQLAAFHYARPAGKTLCRDRQLLGESLNSVRALELKFGVATADHQCEAYDGQDEIRDVWERVRGIVARGKATDFWNRYREDIELARGLGCTVFRLSLSWAQLEPHPGAWNDEAFAHYRDVLQAMRDAKMSVVVTLVHNTWPLHVQAAGAVPVRSILDFPIALRVLRRRSHDDSAISSTTTSRSTSPISSSTAGSKAFGCAPTRCRPGSRRMRPATSKWTTCSR